MVSVTGIACIGGNGRPMEEAGFETVPTFCTSALPKELSHVTSSSSHDTCEFLFQLNSSYSLNFIRLLRVLITPLRGKNDSKQSDEIQAITVHQLPCEQ